MKSARQQQRKMEQQVRLLCSLGLDWRVVMPDLMAALRAVVNFPFMSFGWYNNNLQPSVHYAEWEPLRHVGKHFHSEFHQKNRMLEICCTAAEEAALPPIVTFQQRLKIPQQDYLRHPFYHEVGRPALQHHLLCIRLGYQNGMLAKLNINRPPGDPAFSSTEQQTLTQLLPFLSNAVNHYQSYSCNQQWPDAEPGLLIFDRDGKLHFADDIANRLLDFALERRREPRNFQHVVSRESPLKPVLRKLAGQLDMIRQGNPDASPAIFRQTNHWGEFEFKARWLYPSQPGDGQLFAASLQRKIPLPLKLALNLRQYPLSLKESEIAIRLALGDTYPEIAKRFHIGETTVITHARQIFEKLEIEHRTDLIAALLR